MQAAASASPPPILTTLANPRIAYALLDSSADAQIFVNEQGTILLVNTQFENIFGYRREEILGKCVELLLPERFRELHVTNRNEYNTDPHVRHMCSGLDLFARKKDGTEFVVDISLSPIQTVEGLIVCAAIRDMTDRQRLIEERICAIEQAKDADLRRAEEAEEARRIQQEAMDTICHEIRSPLTGLFGAVALLNECLQKLAAEHNCSAEVLSSMQQNISMMQQCLQQQKILVDDVLDLSKLDAKRIELHPEPLDLEEMLISMRHVFCSQLQAKHLQLHVRMPQIDGTGSGKLLIRVDKTRFLQIVLNLVSNAVKFTHAGEITIVVSLQNLPDENNDCNSNNNNSKTIVSIRVEDTGIGMTKEEVARLFERYIQANRRIACEYGGSGLGLVISKRLVELMGGQLSIESEKDHGTKVVFTVAAEVLQPQPEAAKASPSPISTTTTTTAATTEPVGTASALGRRLLALVVEDNLINQKVLCAYLDRAGHSYQVATNGLEAVTKCSVMDFDIIFMDIEMPVMGGLEATRKIRNLEQEKRKRRRTPVIGLSGNARKEQIDAALAAGMDDYITKPYHEEQIRKVLAHLASGAPTPIA